MPLVSIILSLGGLLTLSCASPNNSIVTYGLPARATNGNGVGPSDVGIWYCTYYRSDWTHLFDGNPDYTRATHYWPLCSPTSNDFRHYASNDISIIDFHLQQLADAQIDFILLELTPAGLGAYPEGPDYRYMVDCALVTCGRINEWNKNHSWKIHYAVAVGLQERGGDSLGLAIAKVSKETYETFYNNQNFGGPSNYYWLNGKPLLVCYSLWTTEHPDPPWNQDRLDLEWNAFQGDKTYGNHFTLRTATAHEGAGQYGWPLPVGQTTVLNSEVELVVPGFNVHGDIQLRDQGAYYQACWEKVLSNKRPQIVMIQAFNDYCEDSAVWTTDTSRLDATQEKWYGPSGLPPGMQYIPSVELRPAMYWNMTKLYIKLLRSGAH